MKMDIFTPTASVSLFESMLAEASTALDLLRSHPGGDALVKYAHKSIGLPHGLKFDEVKSVKWTDVAPSGYSNKRKINWILIKGKTGTGLIKVKERGDYFVAAANTTTDDDVPFSRQTSGGNAVSWLKKHIGAFNRFLISVDPGELADLQNKRQTQKQGSSVTFSDTMTEREIVQYLVTKFKPFWVRAINGAMNDVKGWVSTQVKNHAWEKATRKISRLAALEKELEKIQDNAGEPDQIHKAVTYALHLAAAHYYPEDVEWIQNYGDHGSRSIDSKNRSAKINQLFKDIRNGQTEKLGSILAFFRRSLATG